MTHPPCIYCRRVDVPRTREHVLQRALGGSATLPTQVCADCNAALSVVDKAFVEIARAYHLGEDILRTLRIGRVRTADGSIVAARLNANKELEFLPQAREVTPGQWRLSGSDERVLRRIPQELAAPSRLEITARLVEPGDGVPRFLLLRSAPFRYLLEGTERVALDELHHTLTTKGLTASPATAVATSEATSAPLTFESSIDLHALGRGLAKITLNYVCHRLGPEVALAEELDELRAFARYGEGYVFDFVVPAMLSELRESNSARPYFHKQHHGIILIRAGADDGHRESALVVLGGEPIGKVDLQRAATRSRALPDGTWLVTRFDPTSTAHEDFTLPHDMFRAVIAPAALGLKAEFESVNEYLSLRPL